MTFKDLLNEYLKEFNCNSKKISELTNISPSVISRYRSGQRRPEINSIQTDKIINAIFELGNNKYKKEDIKNNILNSLKKDDFNYENFSKNLNDLINILKINLKDMSKYTLYDSSHISRIRYGKTKPSEPIEFSKKTTNYIINKYNCEEDIKKISILLDIKDLNINNLYNHILTFLTNSNNKTDDKIEIFLTNLDKFNLNDYIKAIKFDELKIPNVPFYITKTKSYYGIEEMKKGELDFFKGTVLTKNNEVFMCSDMPMEDMAKDVEFGKKWMFGIACMLKKGIHLDIIHNLDRSFNEMMLGLESWIPIYMTGQITPYYFKDIKTNIYQNLTYTSQTLALSGESINGHHNKGKYYLTNNKKEVEYYQEKAKNLLKKATPLMDIYKKENIDSYNNFLKKYYEIFEPRTRFLSSLPLFTISDTLLTSILKRNKLKKSDIDTILNYKNEGYINYTNILNTSSITDNIHILTKEEFKNSPSNLLLSDIFYNKRITYTYEEYLSHLKETETFSKKNHNYKLNKLSSLTFKNITVTIVNKKFVIISKEENPTIHFIIRHPKLVNAISNFKPIVKETN